MRSFKSEKLTLGVCYYPEHWNRSLWADDLRRMKECGIEVVRVAEFAWSIFEPSEGEFSFEMFDDFMDLTAEENMKVIFCTPSATPPAWMSEKYPEILNADIDGNLIHHGLRRHCNLNSEKYRFFVSRITEKLAEHYSKYPNIIAWQLDNEINCECNLYYSKSDHNAFREYLKAKFGTLDELNKAIGAVFWNQTYTEWEQVYLPRRTNSGRFGNPHMALLQKHFISDTVIDFFRLQADIVRKYTDVYVTTNGLFGYIDYHKLEKEVIDFITYDNYPNFSYDKNIIVSHQNGMRDRNSSYNLTRTRSISPIFGIMEQQSGPAGWNFNMTQPAPKPGQIRLWTMQAIAHGADFVSYFRWRTCTFGTEIYWHGINDYSNKPNRRTEEVKQIYNDIQKIQEVCGKKYIAEAALLRDYDNEWDGAEDIWHSEVDGISYDGWFRAFQKKHIPYDMVYVDDNTTLTQISKYKLLVYPHPAILTKKRADLLEAYAKQGGTVILGCRTGYKNINGGCYTMPMPGYAKELCGAEVSEFTFLSPYDEEQYVDLCGKRVPALCFNDVLKVIDGKSVGEFESNYYKGECAAVVKSIGKGRAYYFGAPFEENAAKTFIELENLKPPADIGEFIDIPESIEIAVRGEYAFFLNYDGQAVEFDTKKELVNLLDGIIFKNKITIDGYGVVVIRL